MDNIKPFNKRNVRPYISDDGITPITKDQAIQEMADNIRAMQLAHAVAVSRGYETILDAPKEEAKTILAEARIMTTSANDDLHILKG